MIRGSENGYTYTGDESAYLVTMLNRDARRKTAMVKIERVLSGIGSIPAGSSVTVPLRRVRVNA